MAEELVPEYIRKAAMYHFLNAWLEGANPETADFSRLEVVEHLLELAQARMEPRQEG